jgi:protein-export membrane protein SecD
MDGSGLKTASAQIGGAATNEWVISFTIADNDEGAKFGPYTSSHIGQPMAIVLDGQVLSAPTIQAALTTGGQITGNFTQQQAADLALQLQYGALPISLHVESTEQVGASLGADSVAATGRAGVLGVAIVLVFMIVSYRVPGVTAAIALLLFAVINFALYKVLGVTLTLPALTGFLISIGTAVDGNILIFERLKEELRLDRPLNKAIQVGFERAWPSIRDSNISTFMIGLVLFFFGGQFGAGSVRGFSITLMLGLVTNIFTAVIVTRTFLNVVLRIAGEAMRTRKWTTGV